MMKIHLLAVVCVSFILLSCGGGGSSPDISNDNDPVPDSTPAPVSGPAIAGFEFSLREGDFWEYEWDHFTSTVSASGGSSGTKRGVFRITLGAPVTVDQLTAYPLILTGNNRSGVNGEVPFITPRWTHIAINDNKILLSSDGIEFKTVFDANTGRVIGFGFFEELSDQNLFEISAGSIDNDYIKEPAYVLSDSASESNCEFFPGVGTICGADVSVDFTMVRREFYQQNIGPVGYYYHFSASSGGTFDSVHVTNTTNIGLVASSTRGDVVDYALETEPNNIPASASPTSNSGLPVTVRGDFSFQQDIDVTLPSNYASNYYLYLNSRPEVEPNNTLAGAESITLNETVKGAINSSDDGEFRSFSIPGFDISSSIEDWYRYQLTEARPFQVSVDFFGAVEGVDIDVWLFDQSGGIIDYSIDDNSAVDGSDDSEGFRADLVTGTYYIGVDIWPDANNGSVRSADYALSVNKASFGSEPAVSNQVAIKDFYRFTLTTTTGLIITSTPSLGIFFTDTAGQTIYASAPESVDPTAIQTVLVTPILQPGEYLIGLGSQNYHYTAENFVSDTYEVTIDSIPAQAQ